MNNHGVNFNVRSYIYFSGKVDNSGYNNSQGNVYRYGATMNSSLTKNLGNYLNNLSNLPMFKNQKK